MASLQPTSHFPRVVRHDRVANRRRSGPVAHEAEGSNRSGWVLALVCVLAAASAALAVTYRFPGGVRAHEMASPPTPHSALARGRLPDSDLEMANRLAHATLTSLGDANRTGNYAVLWALAAPAFQSANSAEALAGIFAGVRRSGLDVAAGSGERPAWLEPPGIDGDGIMRLAGTQRSNPQLSFALGYVEVAGVWRLIEISIQLAPERGGP